MYERVCTSVQYVRQRLMFIGTIQFILDCFSNLKNKYGNSVVIFYLEFKESRKL